MAEASPTFALEQASVVSFGAFHFDRSSGLLFRGDEELSLPPRALGVLEVLIERAGEVVSKDDLVAAVWHDTAVTDQSPAEAIGVIRDALGDDSHQPTYIQTVHRRGYRFIAELESVGMPRQPASRLVPQVTPTERTTAERDRHKRWVVIGAAVVALLLVGGLTLLRPTIVRRPSGSLPALRLRVALPAPLLPTTPPSVSLSPDGTVLAYRGVDGRGVDSLYVLHLDRFEDHRLEGTEGGFGPFFSPDGQWVGYFYDGSLWKISLRGGPPVEVAKTSDGRVSGASWADDGTIVFARGSRSKLWRVPASGGTPALLAAPEPEIGEYAYQWPEVLPGSSWLLLSIEPVGMAALESARLAALSLETGELRRFDVKGGIQPRLLGRDHLVFVRRDSLFAIPFDLEDLEVMGSAEPIIHDLLTLSRAAGQFAVSSAGNLVYVHGNGLESRLFWVDRQGNREELPLRSGSLGRHRFSADYRMLALEIEGDIWLYDLRRGALSRFTSGQSGELTPIWDRDGSRLVFSSNRLGPPDLFVKPTDGSEGEKLLCRSSYPKLADSWSPDGQWLVYSEINPETGSDLWLLSMTGEGEPHPLLATVFDESQASFSPDGRWLAFVSNESGDYQVFVQPFPGPGPRYQVSTRGGSSPEWSPGGRELFFSHGDDLCSVIIESASPFRVSAPATVAEVPNSTSFFAVGPGGRRFLVGQRMHSARPTTVHLVADARTLLLQPTGGR